MQTLLEIPYLPGSESVKTLLKRLFDYAGLFPPAALSMDDAIAEYDRYRSGPDNWMLGPFVCRISNLCDLELSDRLFSEERPLSLSLIAARGTNLADFLHNWSADVQTIGAFIQRRSGTVTIDSIEIALPGDATESGESTERTLDGIIEPLGLLTDLSKLSNETPALFLETTRDQFFASRLEVLCAVIPRITKAVPVLGLKLRCGGIEPADFPTPEEIATFLVSVIDSANRFKATAGLHHPVRGWNDAQQVTMHGFLNVFIGAALYADGLIDREGLIHVIAEEDPSAFVFEERRFGWRDARADLTVLDDLRQTTALSIGSCSFDEPREDLCDLGWLHAGNEPG